MKLVLPGNPIAKARHKDFVKVLNNGKIFRGRYNPQDKLSVKTRGIFEEQLPIDFQVLQGPLFVQLWYGLKRPKSHYGTGKNDGIVKPSAPKYPDKKPDIDNFEKFIFDCLSGVIIRDDSQIVSCRHDKRYSENPRVEIQITELK